jgi:precorrin-4/cobalt-precorrin-4 C11-methyltransferase
MTMDDIALFTSDHKRHEQGLKDAAAALGIELVFLPRAALEAAAPRCETRSQRVEKLLGLPSLAEAAALAGAGGGSRLVLKRISENGASCAVAQSAELAQSTELARSRGGGAMTVHFIGAGPGAPDLITLRGRDLLARCPVCLCAGSLVPKELLQHCPKGARIVDTAPMTLDEIEAEFVRAHAAREDVARLHSGDLSVWSAMSEQLRRLDRLAIPYTITPGVPSFAAAAAALACELTLPEIAQSLVLTRTSGRASSMPPRETLENFARTGATLAVHLSIHALESVVAQLAPHYGEDCPAAVVYRASWPDERIVKGTLATIASLMARMPVERTALILVGRVLGAQDFRESALYDPGYRRRYRMTDQEGER